MNLRQVFHHLKAALKRSCGEQGFAAKRENGSSQEGQRQEGVKPDNAVPEK